MLKQLTGDMSVFVTVGTTSFDSLVETVTSSDVKKLLQSIGYSKLIVQYGRGLYEPENMLSEGFITEVFKYKNSIAEDIANASLVISHAGAGSCLEVLGAKKPLIVVVNEDLMGNHQSELARQLYEDKHLLYCTPGKLKDTIKEIQTVELKHLPSAETEKFAAFIESYFGID